MASWKGFRPYMGLGGPEPVPVWEKAAASQNIHRGDAVIKDGNGFMTIGLAGSAAIYGVAAADVVTTAADEQTEFPVYPAKKGQFFIGTCSGTWAKSLEGEFCAIEGATNVMQIDENATGTTDVVQVIQAWLAEGDVVGTSSNIPVIFTFRLSQFDGQEI